MPKNQPEIPSKPAIVRWLKRILDQTADNLADKIGEQLAAALMLLLTYLISLTKGWWTITQIAVVLCGIVLSSIIVSVFHRRQRPAPAPPPPTGVPGRRELHDPTHRNVDSYKVTVIFGANRRPQSWEIREHISSAGNTGSLKNLPGVIYYKSGVKDLQINPLNVEDSRSYIKIDPDNVTRISNQQYNFVIELVPPLKSGQTRELAYEVVPVQPGPAPSYLFVASYANKVPHSTFEVKFTAKELPINTKVTKVYWPRGVGEQGSGGVVMRRSDGGAASYFVDPTTHRANVAFTGAEIDRLDQEHHANPEQRCYGIMWQWEPLANHSTNLFSQLGTITQSLGRR